MICVVPIEDLPVIGPFATYADADSFLVRLRGWVPAEIRDMVAPADWETVWAAEEESDRPRYTAS